MTAYHLHKLSVTISMTITYNLEEKLRKVLSRSVGGLRIQELLRLLRQGVCS